MKRFIPLVLLFWITILPGQSNSLSPKLHEYFTALTQLGQFNGNVLIDVKGKKILDEVYNIPNSPRGMRVKANSRFIMASVSKVYTKVAILRLVEMGKLNLSDKLSRFIPDFPNGDSITIIHLLNHQSGLPRELSGDSEEGVLSPEQAATLAKSEKLLFSPGTQTHYSNIGYLLLHFIINQTAEKGYFDFIGSQVLKKMKLNQTGEYSHSQQIKHFAPGYSLENNQFVPVPSEKTIHFETGNYYTSMHNLYRFSKQMLSGKAIAKERAMKMFEKDSLLVQAGGRSGYRAYFYKNLKTETTFLFLSNDSDIPFQKITEDVMKILEGKEYTVPRKIMRKEISVAPEKIKRYEGKYALQADPSNYFFLSMENGNLILADDTGQKTILKAETETVFFDNPESEESFIFIWNEQTQGFELTVLTDGINLKTEKIK